MSEQPATNSATSSRSRLETAVALGLHPRFLALADAQDRAEAEEARKAKATKEAQRRAVELRKREEIRKIDEVESKAIDILAENGELRTREELVLLVRTTLNCEESEAQEYATKIEQHSDFAQYLNDLKYMGQPPTD